VRRWSLTRERVRSTLAPELLSLRGVHAHYGPSHVLHGVDLTLRQGHLLALLGRNGAGKTTTMLTIAGLLAATGGQILLAGVPMQNRPPEATARSGVRLVPQGRRIFPSLSVHENLIVAAQKRSTGLPGMSSACMNYSLPWSAAIGSVRVPFPVASNRCLQSVER